MNTNTQRSKRQMRTRRRIKATSDRTRLSVFRSNKYLYAQIINDKIGKTIVGISEKQLVKITGTRLERAKQMGAKIAILAKDKKITHVVFDRGRYSYHGRVKAFAEGAREGGLQF